MNAHHRSDDAIVDVHTARLRALLQRALVRTRLTRLARVLSLALPVVSGAVALAAWAAIAPPVDLAIAAAVALIATAATTVARAPTLSTVAADLDVRLALADRLSTAVRMLSRGDAVAGAIVKDAAARLSSPAVTDALPYRAHPRAGLAWLAALACAVLWAAGPSSASRTTRAGDSGRTIASGAAVANPDAPVSRETAPSPDAPAVAPRVPEAAAPATAGADARRRDAGASDDRPSGDSAAATRAAQTGTNPAPSEAPAPGRRGGRSDSAESGRAGAGSEASTAGAGRSAPAAATAARAGGAPATGAVSNGAGGVRRGTLTAAEGADVRPTSGARVSAAMLAAARANAEAAIAHDDIPPRHRAYLRDYYRAVSTVSQP